MWQSSPDFFSPSVQGRNFVKIIGVAISCTCWGYTPFVPHRAIGVMLNLPNVGVVAATPTCTKVLPMILTSSLAQKNLLALPSSRRTIRTQRLSLPAAVGRWHCSSLVVHRWVTGPARKKTARLSLHTPAPGP